MKIEMRMRGSQGYSFLSHLPLHELPQHSLPDFWLLSNLSSVILKVNLKQHLGTINSNLASIAKSSKAKGGSKARKSGKGTKEGTESHRES